MKFLEAAAILKSFEGGKPLEFLLAMSGQPEPLEIFLKAAAAEEGYAATIRTLPFNTLSQLLLTKPREGEREVYLLLPWDLLPEADWRSGVPASPRSVDALLESAHEAAERLQRRGDARFLYCDAPLPSLLANDREARSLRDRLRAIAASMGAEVLEERCFSLDGHFESGAPVAPTALGAVARRVVAAAVSREPALAKVLVTDFDNTLWRGVVGEDGVDGLAFVPQGAGFPHFVYQTLLRRLNRTGILLAGVTRNDPDLAIAPLQTAESVLAPEDFVSIMASYGAKSAQISEIAERLNLGLDSFVFVDDNPVELAEVGQALPDVRSLRFPESLRDFPDFVWRLSRLFHRGSVTEEDSDRTDLYRRRLAGMAPSEASGSDLTEFLAGLEMVLTIRDRTEGDRERAVQLINKTNQFNLNGIRRSPDEVTRLLTTGARLYTASLADRHGQHGEIVACLVDGDEVIRSFVMSCRVFQRRVEHAFMAWLVDRLPAAVELEFARTERNEPMRRFMEDPAFRERDGVWRCDLASFAAANGDVLGILELEDTTTQRAGASP